MHVSAHFTVAEFGFRLTLKLRFGKFYGYYCRQPLSDVFTCKFIVVFYKIEFFARIVYEFRKRKPETVYMCTAFFGIDIVGESDDVFIVSVVILHSDFNRYGIVVFAEIQNLTYRLFIGVKKFYIFRYSALV